jgi:hypothetical protein
MKKHLAAIIILCTAGVSSLHAYISQPVTNTVQSFIPAPQYFSLQGQTMVSPTNQYGATWTGEALLATNGTFTGKGVIISFANGATNSTQESFILTAPSLIKGPVLREDYATSTNTDVWQNTYGNGVGYFNVTNSYINKKYVYSADCILTATNSFTSFLLKGRVLYEVTQCKTITPQYVIPQWIDMYGTTNPAVTNAVYKYINIYTNVTISLAAFSTNNAYWGYISGYSTY